MSFFSSAAVGGGGDGGGGGGGLFAFEPEDVVIVRVAGFEVFRPVAFDDVWPAAFDVVTADEVDIVWSAGGFGFVLMTGGFGAGVGGFGLFVAADAVPQMLVMVNAAKARAIGNERRIFLVSGFVRRPPPRT